MVTGLPSNASTNSPGPILANSLFVLLVLPLLIRKFVITWCNKLWVWKTDMCRRKRNPSVKYSFRGHFFLLVTRGAIFAWQVIIFNLVCLSLFKRLAMLRLYFIFVQNLRPDLINNGGVGDKYWMKVGGIKRAILQMFLMIGCWNGKKWSVEYQF